MDNHPLLSSVETAGLIELAQSGDKDAVERLVCFNQRLVYKIANRYFNSGFGGDQELEDIVQWGNIGLLRSIQKWDAGRGLAFSTYAVGWIHGAIRRNARMRGNRLGMSDREGLRLSSIRRAVRELYQATGKEPTVQEIATKTGLDLEYVQHWRTALIGSVSLDDHTEPDEDDQPLLYEKLPVEDDDPPEDSGERAALLEDLRRMIHLLPERQCEVITRRYLTDPPDTCVRIAQDMHISYQRVQMIERDALNALRFKANLNLSP